MNKDVHKIDSEANVGDAECSASQSNIDLVIEEKVDKTFKVKDCCDSLDDLRLSLSQNAASQI